MRTSSYLNRRLHRHHRKHLQEVVLHNVADDAVGIEIPAPSTCAERVAVQSDIQQHHIQQHHIQQYHIQSRFYLSPVPMSSLNVIWTEAM
jgi:hypothetical protein